MDEKRIRKKTRKKMGILSFLTILFIVLKVFGVISWPWIFSPIWISAICAVLIFGIILVGGRIAKGKW